MRNLTCLFLLASLAGCGDEARVTRPIDALADQSAGPRYRIVKYTSTLGGASARGSDINERGWIAGSSNLTDGTRHAALWRERIADRSQDPRRPQQQRAVARAEQPRVMVVGIAETDRPNPLNEDWSCSAFFPSVTS